MQELLSTLHLLAFRWTHHLAKTHFKSGANIKGNARIAVPSASKAFRWSFLSAKFCPYYSVASLREPYKSQTKLQKMSFHE